MGAGYFGGIWFGEYSAVVPPTAIDTAAVAAAFSIPAPTLLFGGIVLTPNAVTAAWSIATPAFTIGATIITTSAVIARWVIGSFRLTPFKEGTMRKIMKRLKRI